MGLRRFLSELRGWVDDLRTLGIVLICAVAYFLWFLALFTLFFVNALAALCWVPLPLIGGVIARFRMERNSRKDSEAEKAKKERAKTRTF